MSCSEQCQFANAAADHSANSCLANLNEQCCWVQAPGWDWQQQWLLHCQQCACAMKDRQRLAAQRQSDHLSGCIRQCLAKQAFTCSCFNGPGGADSSCCWMTSNTTPSPEGCVFYRSRGRNGTSSCSGTSSSTTGAREWRRGASQEAAGPAPRQQEQAQASLLCRRPAQRQQPDAAGPHTRPCLPPYPRTWLYVCCSSHTGIRQQMSHVSLA